jgi:hypothetical protein
MIGPIGMPGEFSVYVVALRRRKYPVDSIKRAPWATRPERRAGRERRSRLKWYTRNTR